MASRREGSAGRSHRLEYYANGLGVSGRTRRYR